MKPVRIAFAINSVFVRARELLLQLLHVEAHGRLGDEEPLADLTVGHPLGGEFEHRFLARGRDRVVHPRGDHRVELLDDLGGGRAVGGDAVLDHPLDRRAQLGQARRALVT